MEIWKLCTVRGNYLIVHKDHPLHVKGVNSGAEMATIFLARFLAKAGRKVVVAGMLDESEDTVDDVQFWDLGEDFNVGKVLQRMASFGPYHLISAGRAVSLMMAKGDPACLSRTLITHDRAGNDTGIKPDVLCRIADHIVCVSHAQAEVFISSGADPSKVNVIHNGADLDLFAPANPASRDYQKLVFVGALVQDKGIHVLINSFARLKQQFPALTLDVYGSAGLWGREKMFDEAEILRQLPGIVFHGKTPQAQIAAAYAKAGICVIPSIWFDPFPLVSLEAQVTGCPVVAFNVGGLGEGMVPGKTGILLDNITEEELTRCLAELLGNPSRLKEMSQQALEFARKTFTWDRVVDRITTMCEATDRNPDSAPLQEGTIGFLSTWNQQCGLATYGKYLASRLPEGSYVVLAEDSEEKRTAPDEPFVIRCWKKQSSDFSALRNAIEKTGVKLIHLNCQARFFAEPAFSDFLKELRGRGIIVLSHLHNTFTLDESLQHLMQGSSAVIVHTAENRLEAIANGAPAATTFTLPHGVDVKPELSSEEKQELRLKHGLPAGKKIITSFGFVQAHKGIEGMIEAVSHLRQGGVDCIGIVAGTCNRSDPSSEAYLAALKDFAVNVHVADSIRFLDRFLTDEEVMEYLAASDVVVMNYRSNYFEASGACALAVGARALVAASIAPPFMCFGDAVFHITGGYPADLALRILLTDSAVKAEMRNRVNAYCEENSWQQVAKKVLGIYEKLGLRAAAKAQPKLKDAPRVDGIYDMSSLPCAFQELIDKAEIAATSGDFQNAHALLVRAGEMGMNEERALSARGAIYLAEKKKDDARELFQAALSHSPRDVRSLCGLGICEMEYGNIEEAFKLFLSALETDPFHLLSITRLVACSYSLGRLSELENILRHYTVSHPKDLPMQYCYAGCLVKQGKYDAASAIVDEILRAEPDHKEAKELKGIITRERAMRHILGGKAAASSEAPPAEVTPSVRPGR